MRSAAIAILIGLAAAVARGEEPAPEEVHMAINRAVPLLETAMAGYARQRDCFSCHHQGVPVVALDLARRRGFAVDEHRISEALDLVESDLGGAIEDYRRGRGQGGGATRAGYALWALDAGGWKPDDLTAAVVEFFLSRDRQADHWRTSSHRPPSESSDITTTFVSLRALRQFPTPAQQARAADRIANARDWLLHVEARDTEERAFRLLGLNLAGADPDARSEARRTLLATQRPDGGWSQLDGQTSDAYATGLALVALSESGLPVTDPAYRRGLTRLLRTQAADGSWFVASRSKPFQEYFESGFPYGPDQFISTAATAWATSALILGCP